MRFDCPLRIVGANAQEPPDIRRPSSVSVSNPEQLGPRIKASESKAGCHFRILKEPVAPFTRVDWRIGHAITDIQSFLGRKVDVEMRLSADQAMALDAGSFYVYDGIQVREVGVRTRNPRSGDQGGAAAPAAGCGHGARARGCRGNAPIAAGRRQVRSGPALRRL